MLDTSSNPEAENLLTEYQKFLTPLIKDKISEFRL
jgi:hypothetical protein